MTLEEYRARRNAGESAEALRMAYSSERAKQKAENRAKIKEPKPIELNDDDVLAVELALASGNSNASPYIKEASNIYMNLWSQGSAMARESGLKPGTDTYDRYMEHYMTAKWPTADKTPISLDMMNTYYTNSTNAVNERRAQREQKAQQTSAQNNWDAMQYGLDPAAGYSTPNAGSASQTPSYSQAPSYNPGYNAGSYGSAQQSAKVNDFLSQYYDQNP